MDNRLIESFNSSKGSINRHSLDGVSAYNYFSPKQIIKELVKNNEILHFDLDQNILVQANNYLLEKKQNCELVENIIYDFGIKLAKVLYILHCPTKEQIASRKEYTSEDWKYLKSIKKIYLAGGLLTPEFSRIFKKAINDFSKEKDSFKEIVLIENSLNLALNGLKTKTEKDSLVYDFGQTNVKRGVYINNCLQIFDSIPIIIKDVDDLKVYGKLTHDFILNVLYSDLSTYKEIDEVHMAMSNYVKNGIIDPAPWRYGVLYHYEEKYEELLIKKLSEKLNRKISLKLHHDTTSMGYAIEDKKDAILISLGTAFGVSYFKQ